MGEIAESELNRIAHVVHCDRSDLRQHSNEKRRRYSGQDLDVAEPLDYAMDRVVFSGLRRMGVSTSGGRRYQGKYFLGRVVETRHVPRIAKPAVRRTTSWAVHPVHLLLLR